MHSAPHTHQKLDRDELFWRRPRVIWFGAGLLLVVIMVLGRERGETSRRAAHDVSRWVHVHAARIANEIAGRSVDHGSIPTLNL